MRNKIVGTQFTERTFEQMRISGGNATLSFAQHQYPLK